MSARRNTIVELFVWFLLALAVATALRVLRPASLANDSYQYLSMAQNVKNGHWAATSIIHYDTERSHGEMPAPVTWFPPGYPILVGLATPQGQVEQTARIVSSICFAGTVVLFAWGLILLEIKPVVRWLATLLLVANAVTLSLATSVMTESLFTLLATAAVVVIIWAAKQRDYNRIAAGVATGYALIGLAYWARYAGLFLVLAFITYSFVRFLLWRDRVSGTYVVAAAIPAALAGVLMVRNQLLVGTWKGGNELVASHPFTDVVRDLVRAHIHLITGLHVFTFGIWEALLVAGALLTGILLIAGGRIKDFRLPVAVDPVLLLLALCILVYGAGMFYAGLRTVVALESRKFAPILPVYLLVGSIAANRAAALYRGSYRSWIGAGLLVSLIGYAGVNARDFARPATEGRNAILAEEYLLPDQNGQPLRTWVDQHIGREDVILATDGQATGYLLGRPTISLVKPEYTRVRWDCGEIKKQMEQFHACCVILYKPSAETTEDALLAESKFVAEAATHPPPCGFTVAAENADVRILTTATKGPGR